MAKKACAVCGLHEGRLNLDCALYLCDGCRQRDWWNGAPVFEAPPTRCPYCGNKHLDTGREPEETELDSVTMEACGFNLDECEFEDIEKFYYLYEEAVCEECQNAVGYGQRWYWNAETNAYNAPKPLTPKEQLEQERLAQEAAGQMRLFE